MLCYKAAVLLQPSAADERAYIGQRLQALLYGGLNPLKFCQDDVVSEFER